jgi:hypothetical protein
MDSGLPAPAWGHYDRLACGHYDRLGSTVQPGRVPAELPTLVDGDIALTSTRPNAVTRAQVARRQCDGSWFRHLEQPEFVPPTRWAG